MVSVADDMTHLLPTLPAGNNDQTNNCDEAFSWQVIRHRIRIFRQMALPYFRESKRGCFLLAGLLTLTVAQAGVTVAISYLNKDFYNVLVAKDVTKFYVVLGKYLAAFLVGSPITVLYNYQRDQLAVHWREWMTARTFSRYLAGRVYYKLERQEDIDNPDQRISEDINSFTSYSLELGITCLTSFIDLLSFSAILWSIYPALLGVTLVYAGLGTLLTAYLGRTLFGLNFAQLNKEADLRYALVRLRENSESIAFYAGEDLEGELIERRATGVMNNRRKINKAQRNLEFFTVMYGYLVQVLPVAVLAHKYFAGDFDFGSVSQAITAFNHVVKDLCVIINQFEQLSVFGAGLERLSSFYQAMQTISPPTHDTAHEVDSGRPLLEESLRIPYDDEPIKIDRFDKDRTTDIVLTIQSLTLKIPDFNRTLIKNLNLELREGQALLIVGSSGVGKSSLLRAMAGLWTSGSGVIERPEDNEVYFLPQRPYCTLGCLKDQLLYPMLDKAADSDNDDQNRRHRSHVLKAKLTDDDFLEILQKVDLIEVAKRVGDGDAKRGLQSVLDWSNVLSLGEQQRLAFGRVLVNRPRLAVLDEATSALDIAAEGRMYMLLKDMPHSRHYSAPMTYVSVGHRPSLLMYHDRKLHLKAGESVKLENIDKSAAERILHW